MVDLQTNYMGIPLKNPLIVGACSLSKQIDTIRELEEAGAGAVVIKSLFEEQIQLERMSLEEHLSAYDDIYAEAMQLFPKMPHGGPKEHLYWVAETKKSVMLPVIGSLNAVNPEIWVEYARQLADTGVDGLELNFYSTPIDPHMPSAEIEKRELDTFARVRHAVKIPLAVKLHPFYANPLHLAASYDRLGANALVLFNRLFQPDLNVENETERANLTLSSSEDSGHALRWTALIHGRIRADIASSTGILTGRDAIKMILAGATAVQVVSPLYRNHLAYLANMLYDIETWMKQKSYSRLEDFRGKLDKHGMKDPWAYERGQYIKALLGFD